MHESEGTGYQISLVSTYSAFFLFEIGKETMYSFISSMKKNAALSLTSFKSVAIELAPHAC